jgi:hypothetical protein
MARRTRKVGDLELVPDEIFLTNEDGVEIQMCYRVVMVATGEVYGYARYVNHGPCRWHIFFRDANRNATLAGTYRTLDEGAWNLAH